jgi:hypothetical protein
VGCSSLRPFSFTFADLVLPPRSAQNDAGDQLYLDASAECVIAPDCPAATFANDGPFLVIIARSHVLTVPHSAGEFTCSACADGALVCTSVTDATLWWASLFSAPSQWLTVFFLLTAEPTRLATRATSMMECVSSTTLAPLAPGPTLSVSVWSSPRVEISKLTASPLVFVCRECSVIDKDANTCTPFAAVTWSVPLGPHLAHPSPFADAFIVLAFAARRSTSSKELVSRSALPRPTSTTAVRRSASLILFRVAVADVVAFAARTCTPCSSIAVGSATCSATNALTWCAVSFRVISDPG